MKRNVGDDDCTRGRGVAKDVSLADAGVRPYLATELQRSGSVDLYPQQRPLQVVEAERDCAVSGPPLDDGARSLCDEFDDSVDDRPIDEEVLSEFVKA